MKRLSRSQNHQTPRPLASLCRSWPTTVCSLVWRQHSSIPRAVHVPTLAKHECWVFLHISWKFPGICSRLGSFISGLLLCSLHWSRHGSLLGQVFSHKPVGFRGEAKKTQKIWCIQEPDPVWNTTTGMKTHDLFWYLLSGLVCGRNIRKLNLNISPRTRTLVFYAVVQKQPSVELVGRSERLSASPFNLHQQSLKAADTL